MQFTAVSEINTRGSKMATAFIPFHTNYDWGQIIDKERPYLIWKQIHFDIFITLPAPFVWIFCCSKLAR